MANMSLNKVKMLEQDPKIRNSNFNEVSLGYTEEMAKEEAMRCLNCKTKPCVMGCPVNVNIPVFIKFVSDGNFEEAYKIIRETNNLPAICGRVCPQETQCEKFCVRNKKGESVAIGRLERFVADWYLKNREEKERNIIKLNKKVAVIGGGPAGLSCAGDLALLGYYVKIFEAFHIAGGVLMYGIPEFRLPKDIVKKEIDNIKKLGVEIENNMVIGKILSLEEITEEGYEAIFISTGAGLPNFMNIQGENLNGVYSANEFLTRTNLMKAYKYPEYDTPIKILENVAIIGGGNVALDAARSAKRLGTKNVYIIYRRSIEEMPARCEEVEHATEEGIEILFLTNPVEILGNAEGWVTGLKCIKMELGDIDNKGRRKPIEKKESEHIINVNIVIVAIGQSPNPLIAMTTKDLTLLEFGGILADEETGETSIKGIFAGGDIVSGAATVILAMGAGKRSAKAIDKYLSY